MHAGGEGAAAPAAAAGAAAASSAAGVSSPYQPGDRLSVGYRCGWFPATVREVGLGPRGLASVRVVFDQRPAPAARDGASAAAAAEQDEEEAWLEVSKLRWCTRPERAEEQRREEQEGGCAEQARARVRVHLGLLGALLFVCVYVCVCVCVCVVLRLN